MNKRLLIGFLTCLLLSGFAKMPTAYSCPPPQCPECQHWENGRGCVPTCGCWPSHCGFSVSGCENCIRIHVCIDNKLSLDGWGYTWDGDGCPLIYSWDLGLGAYDVETVTPTSMSYRYNSPGDKTVTLTLTRVTSSDPNSCCITPRSFSCSKTVTVVEVASLLPDVGTEFDDGDGDPNTKSFAVCGVVDPNHDPNVVTVTATPNPVVPEQDMPHYRYWWGWRLEGGTGSSYLTRTVDRTTIGVTTISCYCGSSSKTTRIYVVKVDVDIGLSELDELNPGKYINVNWDDDDSDGWTPDDTPPSGVYTGDKGDPNIKDGDNDFRSFTISISPSAIKTDFPNTKVSLTFGGNVKVWETNTKLDANGVSSGVSSGAQFKVADLPKTLYLEGVSGSSAFRDVSLIAAYVPCPDANDIVKVTVFEVTLTGLFGFGPQQSDDEIRHSDSKFQGSSDNNGLISWDDANGDGELGDPDPNCKYFHNCMECQGTAAPSGVTTQVSFDFHREIQSKYWYKYGSEPWTLHFDKTDHWYNDDLREDDEDKTVSPQDHIYQTDGPGFHDRDRLGGDYLFHTCDFREWVTVGIDGSSYQCSDYYKWHSQVYLKPKTLLHLTRGKTQQELGGGWMTIPSSPPSPPPE